MDTSNYKDDYKCPCPQKKLAIPARPPMGTQAVPLPSGQDSKVPERLLEEQRKMLHRYSDLQGAQNKLCNALGTLRREMRDIDNGIMDLRSEYEKASDGRCAPMESVYQTDYSKKQFPIVDYTTTMTSVDKGIWSDPRQTIPVDQIKVGALQGYRDPCNFRFNTLNTVDVGSPSPLSIDRVPLNVQQYFFPLTGRSDYQDSISKKGKEIVDQLEQWREPLPSSRRRCF